MQLDGDARSGSEGSGERSASAGAALAPGQTGAAVLGRLMSMALEQRGQHQVLHLHVEVRLVLPEVSGSPAP